ncbi:MAG: hypothetical protein GY943_33285, partial [Chloroflexi bacterium]|nr:hypothetical protein [Chloroflexota bacterium]
IPSVDFVAIVREAGQLVWKNKSWWLLGGLLGIGNIASTVARLVAAIFIVDPVEQLTSWVNSLIDGSVFALSYPDFGMGVGMTAVSIIIASLLIWIVATVAEGGLITAVTAAKAGQTPSFSNTISAGRRLLKRFVGIDALVFFPWFLLALLIMLALIALIIGTAVSATQFQPQTSITTFAIGLICLIPLSCVLVPVGMLSFVYRSLAFRDAAIHGHPIRQAVRHTWQVVRQNLANFAILTILVVGGSGVANQVLNFAMIPVTALTAVPHTYGVFSFLGLGSILILSTIFLLILSLKAILHAFTAAIWTLAFLALSKSESDE